MEGINNEGVVEYDDEKCLDGVGMNKFQNKQN